MRGLRRRARIGAAVAALALLLAWFVVWMAGASALRRSVASWADDQRGAGLDVAYSRIHARGFPLFLRSVAEEVEVASPGAWRWRAPRLVIAAQPLAPSRLEFSAREPHELDLGRLGVWAIDAPKGRASVEADGERGWMLDIEAKDGAMRRADGSALAAESFALTAGPSAVDKDRIFIGVIVRDAVVARKGATLAINAFEMAFAATAVGALDDGVLPWRDAGGAIEIERLAVATGRGTLALSGTLSVDAAGFPSGRLYAHFINPAPMVDAIKLAGLLAPSDADRAKAALTLAAVAGGGKIAAPIVLSGGEASIAGVRLARLAPLPGDQP
jgi:hypothetical protein